MRGLRLSQQGKRLSQAIAQVIYSYHWTPDTVAGMTPEQLILMAEWAKENK